MGSSDIRGYMVEVAKSDLENRLGTGGSATPGVGS